MCISIELNDVNDHTQLLSVIYFDKYLHSYFQCLNVG